jgi:hypothetical protein
MPVRKPAWQAWTPTHWPVSPNSFGGQINASVNGDMPGDIYRLLGGVVLRQAGTAPAYAGYISSAFLLPLGVNNNRIVAPGAEELTDEHQFYAEVPRRTHGPDQRRLRRLRLFQRQG